MITAHDYLERVQADGAAQFSRTALAADHAGVARQVRHQRVVRATTGSVVAVGVAGVLALAAAQISQPGHGIAPGSSSPPATTSGITPFTGTLSVRGGERIQTVAAELAAAYGVTRAQAYDALVAALPPEANGDPEGWAAVGEYSFKADPSLADAAGGMVNIQIAALRSTGQPQERWSDIIVLASIVEQEAPVIADRGTVATVLQNRLDADMPLDVTSPLAYWQQDYWPLVGQIRPALTDYDTQGKSGLPATAIGAVSRESIAAAADPFPGDALFYLRGDDGRVHGFATYQEFAAALGAPAS